MVYFFSIIFFLCLLFEATPSQLPQSLVDFLLYYPVKVLSGVILVVEDTLYIQLQEHECTIFVFGVVFGYLTYQTLAIATSSFCIDGNSFRYCTMSDRQKLLDVVSPYPS